MLYYHFENKSTIKILKHAVIPYIHKRTVQALNVLQARTSVANGSQSLAVELICMATTTKYTGNKLFAQIARFMKIFNLFL